MLDAPAETGDEDSGISGVVGTERGSIDLGDGKCRCGALAEIDDGAVGFLEGVEDGLAERCCLGEIACGLVEGLDGDSGGDFACGVSADAVGDGKDRAGVADGDEPGGIFVRGLLGGGATGEDGTRTELERNQARRLHDLLVQEKGLGGREIAWFICHAVGHPARKILRRHPDPGMSRGVKVT